MLPAPWFRRGRAVVQAEAEALKNQTPEVRVNACRRALAASRDKPFL